MSCLYHYKCTRGALQYTSCMAGEGVTTVMGFAWQKPRYHRESFSVNPKMDGRVDLAREWFSERIRRAKCSSREPHEQGLASCMILLALGMSLFTGRYWANRGPGTTRRQRNTRRQRREGNALAFLGTTFMGRRVYFVCVHKGSSEAD